MTLLELLMELMMIMDIPTRVGVLDDVVDCLGMLWRSYVQKLVEICWVWRHQEPCKRWMTFPKFWLELMMIVDIPDWGWCPWWRFGWSAYALKKLCFKFGWNMFSLEASRTLSKIIDITGFGVCWRFLTGVDVLDHAWDVFPKVHRVSVSNFMKIWCPEAEILPHLGLVYGSAWVGLARLRSSRV